MAGQADAMSIVLLWKTYISRPKEWRYVDPGAVVEQRVLNPRGLLQIASLLRVGMQSEFDESAAVAHNALGRDASCDGHEGGVGADVDGVTVQREVSGE
jgi:hypothetical protein